MEQEKYHECIVPNLLSLKSLFTFSRRRFPGDYLFNGESHNFTEVVCVIDGKAGVTAGNHLYMLTEGQLIVHPPNEFHKIWTEGEESETIIFSFRSEFFPLLSTYVYFLSAEQISELKSIHHAAESAFVFSNESIVQIEKKKEMEAARVMKRLELFLLSVLSPDHRTEPNYHSVGADNYLRILSVLNQNLDVCLNLDEIAALCDISVSTLEKTIHRFSGFGAKSFYNNLRMKRAAELLCEGLSAKEVAATLNFSCQNYFSLAFKNWSGMSPSLYRKHHTE